MIKESFLSKNVQDYFFEGEFDTGIYQSVWSLMYKYINNLPSSLRNIIHQSYFEGLNSLGFTDKIPTIEYINSKLIDINWKIVLVKGFIPSYIYVTLQKNRIFPVSVEFRKESQLEFSPIADFLHDTWGHLPFLFSREYSNLLQNWAKAASKCQFNSHDEEHYLAADYITKLASDENISQKKILEVLGELNLSRDKINNTPSDFSYFEKFYTWLFEFGALKKDSQPKIIGAAIITSSSELNHFSHNLHSLINVKNIDYKEDIEYGNKQNKYYYALGYKDLKEALSITKDNALQ
jgi:phenylalanine-4-hydroxylase